jgi:hypothetical protein
MISVIPVNEGRMTPEFALSAWPGDDGDRSEVNLIVHTAEKPSDQTFASQALLYGLAIMMLDQRGIIAEQIDKLLEYGPITESEAVRAITFLLKEDFNVQAA